MLKFSKKEKKTNEQRENRVYDHTNDVNVNNQVKISYRNKLISHREKSTDEGNTLLQNA